VNVGLFSLPNLEIASGLSVGHLGGRRDLLNGFDHLQASADQSGQKNALDRFGQKVWDMPCSPAPMQAFDLDSEP
jgi:hypothetical protein